MKTEKINDYLIRGFSCISFFLICFIFNRVNKINDTVVILKTNQTHYVEFKLEIKNDKKEKERSIEKNKDKINDNTLRIVILENKEKN